MLNREKENFFRDIDTIRYTILFSSDQFLIKRCRIQACIVDKLCIDDITLEDRVQSKF